MVKFSGKRLYSSFGTSFSVTILISQLILRFVAIFIPLSHDEGIWAYISSRLVNGEGLFSQIYITTIPLILIPYFVSEKVFGHGVFYLNITGIVWNILTILIIYKVAGALFGRQVGYIAILISFIFTVSYQQEGYNFLLGEHVSQLPLYLSILFLIFALKSRSSVKFFTSGILMGITWNIRELDLIFFLICLLYLIWGLWQKKLRIRHFIFYLTGSLLPIIIILTYMTVINQLSTYIRVVYLNRYKYLLDGQGGYTLDMISLIWKKIQNLTVLILLSTAAFFLFRKNKTENKYLKSIVYLNLLAGILILSATGHRFFDHYFLYLTFSLIIPAAIGIQWFLKRLKDWPGLFRLLIWGIFFLAYLDMMIDNMKLLYSFLKVNLVNMQVKNSYVINGELISFLKSNHPQERVLFPALSAPNYYYLNGKYTEKIPSTMDLSFMSSHGDKAWVEWFEEYKRNPAKLIVSVEEWQKDFYIPEFIKYYQDQYTYVGDYGGYKVYKLTNYP